MTTTIYDILNELWTSATDEYDKGSKFERLMAAYLQTDPLWADRFSDVWLWMDWPDRDGKPDTGIDLVAKDRETGELTAIQCKFYDPASTLQKSDIDSFFTASGKAGFGARLIVSTTDHWSKHAEDALHGQQIPVNRLRVQDLDDSGIDWSQFSLKTPDVLDLKGKKAIRPHQVKALDKVRAGFLEQDRGKLIMACGTGKTFTSLQIVEDLVPAGGSVLFLVPSISLLSQTLREWTLDSAIPLRPFVVCSDTKVGKGNEDISPVDLAYPATTNATKLHEKISQATSGEAITVVFSTYQSLQVVAEAQAMGLPAFDLVVCDEAHRTTGVTLMEEDESNFVRVHDATYLKASKRLYMTATPRIYDDSSKAQASEGGAELASMDDASKFGPEFHRLGFGEAVGKGLLSDYKVLVLAVDEQAVSATFQQQLADENSELKLDDAAKIVGCWNGLAKRGLAEHDFGNDPAPMTRAVAFSRSIKDSQKFADMFSGIVNTYIDVTDLEESDESVLRCEVEHVDGTFNVLRRSERLDWLKHQAAPDTCRILTNARCLSEGVDVPALDAVLFLNPRNSVVDVIQSVGRVMRRAPGKQYGYVILPIGIPSGMTPEQALSDNKKYKVVWQVLQALRAHDDRFNAMVNKIELNKSKNDMIQVIGVGGFDDDSDESTVGKAAAVQTELAFPNLADWREAIYAKIVQKVGDRRYWEDWAASVKDIADTHVTRISALLSDPNLPVQAQFEVFLEGLRGNLNDAISRADAIDMLAQHLITRPVFDALFEGYSFAEHNPVSLVMQAMLDALDEHNLEAENETLDKFYASVRLRAEGIDNAEGKQRIITELYERFFKIAFPRAAESLGIVYTPVEIVDFIIRSVEHVLNTEFNASITDEGVHVLDPFTGTGTFIVRLLQSGLIKPEDLLRKYSQELHANEILLLAYYIAAINIEATFHGITGEAYEPFNGIVLTDTFQMTEDGDTMDEVMFPQNNKRVAHQKSLDIRVIMGNPPYSAGQTSANDANANLKYPTLDKSIATTYADRSTATNKNSLYDSYIRAIRWASNRIETSEHGGVIGFVTNGGYIDSNTADGLRKTLADEFHAIYAYNLRGNARTAGEQRRKEAGNVFDAGGRTTAAILLLVKKPGTSPRAVVRYRDIGDYLTREEKLATVEDGTIDTIQWRTLSPNTAGDWINQRNENFATFAPIGAKGIKGEARPGPIFHTYSAGLKTNRDAWVYNYSHAEVEANVRRMIDFYNKQVDGFATWRQTEMVADSPNQVDEFISFDATKISWNRADKTALSRGVKYKADPNALRTGSYRPFSKQVVYFDRRLNDMVYQLDRIFPTPETENFGIYLPPPGAMAPPWFCLVTDAMPDNGAVGSSASILFPRYSFKKADGHADLFNEGPSDGYEKQDNISPAILAAYRAVHGSQVTTDDVFYYVYGLLHSPGYRHEFASDLKKTLPHIPLVPSLQDFKAFVDAGNQLANLHLNYETADPFPLEERQTSKLATDPAQLRVQKMRFGKSGNKVDKSQIIFNTHITLSGIPDVAHDYMLGSRSALDWIIERYQVKTDKASGIVNDPNAWCDEVGNPRYIIDLVKRIVTVSVETVTIVNSLPAIDFETCT